MGQRIERITESEAEVLKAFWTCSRALTMYELVTELSLVCDWNRSTIKTMVRRLIEKEIIACTKRDVQYFQPLITEQQYRDFQTSRLIEQVYQGKASKLIASLYENQKLDSEDIRELRKLLNDGGHHD